MCLCVFVSARDRVCALEAFGANQISRPKPNSFAIMPPPYLEIRVLEARLDGDPAENDLRLEICKEQARGEQSGNIAQSEHRSNRGLHFSFPAHLRKVRCEDEGYTTSKKACSLHIKKRTEQEKKKEKEKATSGVCSFDSGHGGLAPGQPLLPVFALKLRLGRLRRLACVCVFVCV